MLSALVAAALAVVLFLAVGRRKSKQDPVHDSTPVLDAWLREALEVELATGALSLRGATAAERKPLARTLANEPDADVVAKIEETVRGVDLEFVRYAHETDVEATVRVRYEDGRSGTTTRRLALADVPEAVRTDFDQKGSTRVFRSWAFPWQRVHAL